MDSWRKLNSHKVRSKPIKVDLEKGSVCQAGRSSNRDFVPKLVRPSGFKVFKKLATVLQQFDRSKNFLLKSIQDEENFG